MQIDDLHCSPAPIKFLAVAASSSGANTLKAAVPGKKIRVLSGCIIANGSVNAKFTSAVTNDGTTTTTDLTGLAYLAANVGFIIPMAECGNFETGVGGALGVNLSGATAIGGWIVYQEVG